MTDKKIVVAGALLSTTIIPGMTCVLQEWRTDFGPGWMYPGGKPEGGESVRETLEREMREELGIEILEAEPLGEGITSTEGWTVHAFIVTRWTGQVPAETLDGRDTLMWRNIHTAKADERWMPSQEISRRIAARLREFVGSMIVMVHPSVKQPRTECLIGGNSPTWPFRPTDREMHVFPHEAATCQCERVTVKGEESPR